MTRLHVNILGHGKPIVFLHGWGWHSGIWQPLIPYLQNKYRLYLIDLPGFGKSPLLTDHFTVDAIAPHLLNVVPHEAAWLGWSMGGLFAEWIAIHHPERVTRLITVASTPRFVADVNWPGVSTQTLEKFSTQLTANIHKTLREFLELQLRGNANHFELFETLENHVLKKSHPLLQALIGGLQLLRETDLRNDLKKIRCESLHIFGTHDTIVPVKIAELLPNLLHYSRCEILSRTGHIPFLSHSDKFIELLTQFLD